MSALYDRSMRIRGGIAAVTAATGTISLLATAIVLACGVHFVTRSALAAISLAEVAASFLLIALTVRTAPPRSAVLGSGPAVLATGTWTLRFQDGSGGSLATTALGCLVWSLAALLAVAVGGYLRAVDGRQVRAVDEARRAQRLQLTLDLHDYVAHDVSAMLAQAQAGQILAELDPGRAAEAFRRIERAGHQALASLDRTVRMLHDESDENGESDEGDVSASSAPLPTITDLPDLVDRFSSSGPAAVRLTADPVAARAGRGVGTTAYRVVLEALTNIRRHAPSASTVTVAVEADSAVGSLRVVVVNDAASPAPLTARKGGLGLAGLAERVEALGGTMTAGPCEPSGWRVSATMPMPTPLTA